MKKPLAFRRARHLVSYWQDGDLIVQNYATGARVVVRPEALAVLDFFREWRTTAEIRARYGASSEAVSPLVAATLLERSDAAVPARAAGLERWERWNPIAGFFHMSTRDLRFMDSADGDRLLRRKAREVPLPAPVKRIPGARRVALPRVRGDGAFARVLLARRTWRQFARRPLPLAFLAELLGLTNGVQQWATLRGQGDLPLKTSPSGGARHPIEVYVCSRRVDGLPPGLYHYASDRHRLELVARHRRPIDVERYLPTQFWYGGAAALVFFTAIFSRSIWKYSSARAYRAVLIEAGHQCQTFCLTATALGLAPFCSMALADSRIEGDLGLDGVSEAVIYAAGVGVRPGRVVSPSKPAGYPPLRVRTNPWLHETRARRQEAT